MVLLAWEQAHLFGQGIAGKSGREANESRLCRREEFFSPALGCGSPTFTCDTPTKKVSQLAGYGKVFHQF